MIGQATDSVTSIVIDGMLLNQTPEVGTTNWHARVQVATLDDIAFATPLIDAESKTLQSGWLWQDDQLNALDQSMVAIPAGGMSVSTAQQRRQGHVGVVMYEQRSGLRAFVAGGKYLARWQQWNGVAYGDWTSLPILTV